MRKQLALLMVATMFGCGGSSTSDPLKNIDALLILQRAPRLGEVGDVFQYTSYVPGARLVKLDPPTADGKLTELCCSQFGNTWKDMDIQSYDLAYDAKSIVLSARLAGADHYALYLLTLNDQGEAAAEPAPLATDPTRDYVYPIFATQDRVIFVTNSVVEAGTPQHRDEYERGETTQLGSISIDGTGEILGPRNLSHRVSPSMLHTGQVMFTQWDHLGDVNAGHLMMTNPDFTNLREVFGKENTGRTNSYLKAVEFPVNATEAARPDIRLVTIGTSRDRTLQSGKILDVLIGRHDDAGVWRQSEANASYEDLTPLVPADREPSQNTIGRYYDAYPVRADDGGRWAEKPFFVVSWADGPVEESTLAAANLMADFGVYLYDSSTGARRPIFNDPAKWDVLARPFAPRTPPASPQAEAGNGFSDTSALVGSLDVTKSSLATIMPGQAVKVRVLEGFSVEEGIPDDFGLTEHEGAARLGETDVKADGSWAALVPANVPIHLQPVDKFGMAIVSEPVWFSARPGESRFCGGCHEDRASTTVIQPGITQAIAAGPALFDLPRAQRRSDTFTQASVFGVPWDKALQPIFTAKCAGCHDGDPNKPGNKSLTITDPTPPGFTQTIVFDLRDGPVAGGIGPMMLDGYSKSHLSLLGPMLSRLEEDNPAIMITGDMPVYVEPAAARKSLLFEKLNPPQLYPTADCDAGCVAAQQNRFKPGAPVHPQDVGGQALTNEEYYLLILSTDAGGQFYSRENAPAGI
jgi:hypothetical protein